MSLDRLSGNEILMTQAVDCQHACVRREGVTEVAHKLQQAD
jgi:hypothetical protein